MSINNISSIKGFLKMIVLNQIYRHDLTGYDILKYVEESIGKRPSPGSIYPLMKSLEDNRMVKSIRKGKRKIYSITAKGKREISKLHRIKEELIMMHIQINDKISSILSNKHDLNLISRIDDLTLDKRFSDWIGLKKVALRLMLRDDYPKIRSRLQKILEGTEKRLLKL